MATEPAPQATLALQTPAPAQIYINGFKAGTTAADIFLILERNGTDFAVLNMSYTIAKSLGVALNGLIEKLEKKTGRTIMTTNDVATAIAAHAEEATSV